MSHLLTLAPSQRLTHLLNEGENPKNEWMGQRSLVRRLWAGPHALERPGHPPGEGRGSAPGRGRVRGPSGRTAGRGPLWGRGARLAEQRRHGVAWQGRLAGAEAAGAHLIAPLEHVLVPVLDGVVDVQELENPVPPHVVGVALGLLPAQRRALGQQPHGCPLLLLGADGDRPLRARGASRTLSCPQKAAAAAAAPPRGGALGPQPAEGRSAPLPCAGSLPPRWPTQGSGAPRGHRGRGREGRLGGSRPGGLARRPLRLPPRSCSEAAATDPTATVRQRLWLLFTGVVHCLLPTCDQDLRRHRACPVPLSAHSRLRGAIRRSAFYRLRAEAGKEGGAGEEAWPNAQRGSKGASEEACAGVVGAESKGRGGAEGGEWGLACFQQMRYVKTCVL